VPGAARKHEDRLAANAEFTPDSFPDISKQGKTKAKPEDFEAAVGAEGNSCKGCHDKFCKR
jgi:cytochrome c556